METIVSILAWVLIGLAVEGFLCQVRGRPTQLGRAIFIIVCWPGVVLMYAWIWYWSNRTKGS